LFAFFAYPTPAAPLIGSLVGAYMDSKGDIRSVVRAILTSDAFYSDESRYGHIKSPVEYTVGAIRMVGAQSRERGLIQALRSMGQDILNPPNVAGWAGGRAWINPSTLLERFNFAARLASQRGDPNDGGLIEPLRLLGEDVKLQDGTSLVDRLSERLDIRLSPDAHGALVAYVQSPLTFPAYVTGNPNPQQVQLATDARLRGAIHLALASTDFQIG
jgi:hypothetical protein